MQNLNDVYEYYGAGVRSVRTAAGANYQGGTYLDYSIAGLDKESGIADAARSGAGAVWNAVKGVVGKARNAAATKVPIEVVDDVVASPFTARVIDGAVAPGLLRRGTDHIANAGRGAVGYARNHPRSTAFAGGVAGGAAAFPLMSSFLGRGSAQAGQQPAPARQPDGVYKTLNGIGPGAAGAVGGGALGLLLGGVADVPWWAKLGLGVGGGLAGHYLANQYASKSAAAGVEKSAKHKGARKPSGVGGVMRDIDNGSSRVLSGLSTLAQTLQNDHEVRRPLVGAGIGALVGEALGLPWWATGLLGAAGGAGGHALHRASGDVNYGFGPRFVNPLAKEDRRQMLP